MPVRSGIANGQRRSAVPWNIVLGVGCMSIAALTMLDPDYPMASGRLLDSSTNSPVRLVPRAVAPVGRVMRDRMRFEWRWAGPSGASDWRLVVLDADFTEIFEGTVDSASDVPASLSAELRPMRRYHWYVESRRHPSIRSSIVAFEPL